MKDVRVRYKHASGKWKIVLFHKHGSGYVAEIPCDAVGEKGDVLYYVQSVDSDARHLVRGRGRRAAQGRAPRRGRRGAARARRRPTEACNAAPSSPSSPAACEGAGCGETPKPGDGTFHNWFGVYYEPDVSFISGNSDVCNETNQSQW